MFQRYYLFYRVGVCLALSSCAAQDKLRAFSPFVPFRAPVPGGGSGLPELGEGLAQGSTSPKILEITTVVLTGTCDGPGRQQVPTSDDTRICVETRQVLALVPTQTEGIPVGAARKLGKHFVAPGGNGCSSPETSDLSCDAQGKVWINPKTGDAKCVDGDLELKNLSVS